MPVHAVESLDDPRLDPYRSLKRTDGARRPRVFIVEGEKLLSQLLDLKWSLESLLVSDRWWDRLRKKIPADIDVYLTGDAQLQQVIGFRFHRGVLTCARRPPEPSMEERLAAAVHSHRLVVCPNVADPENFAAVIRTAAALGWDGMLVGRSCPDAFSRRVLRVSMGAALIFPLIICPNIAAALQRLIESGGFEVIAAVAKSTAPPLNYAPLQGRIALVLGNEGDGIEPSVRNLCTREIAIPIQAAVDSLNVAVAAGILLHHYRRD